MRLFLRMATLLAVGTAVAALIAVSLSTVRPGAGDGDRALRDGASVGEAWERAVMPLGGLLDRGDEAGMRAINGQLGKSDIVDATISQLNRDAPYTVPVALFLTWLWFLPPNGRPGCGARERAVLLVIGMVIAFVLAKMWMQIATYPRPMYSEAWVRPHPDWLLAWDRTDPSYPSDHAAQLFAIAVGLLLWDRRFGLPALVGALLMSLPRLYIGGHYPTDIVGGALAGALGAGVARLAEADLLPVMRRGLKWAEARPHVFYPLALLLALEMVRMFSWSRELLRLALRSGLHVFPT